LSTPFFWKSAESPGAAFVGILCIDGAIGSREIAEALPFGQLFVKVCATGESRQLAELLLIGPVQAFDLAVELSELGLM